MRVLRRKDDIEFLERFRAEVDRYLFLGFAPPVSAGAHEYDAEALGKMNTRLEDKEVQELRRTINEKRPRVKSLLVELNLYPTMITTPPPAVGGPVLRYSLLDLITENLSDFRIPTSRILDVFDQAIGKLKDDRSEKPTMTQPSSRHHIFISHSSKDSTVVNAINQAFQDLTVRPYFVEETPRGAPPTKEIDGAVRDAKAVFVFFTYSSITGETRDWIVFEIGLAVAHDRPVYFWKQKGLPKELLPRMVEQVTTYNEFEISSNGVLKLAENIRTAAKIASQEPRPTAT